MTSTSSSNGSATTGAASPTVSIDELSARTFKGDLPFLKKHANSVAALINATEKEGNRTMTYTAARQGYLDVCCYLVDTHHANINANANGSTALHAATFGGHYGVVEYLLDKGADRTMKNKYGLTAEQEIEYRESPDKKTDHTILDLKQAFERGRIPCAEIAPRLRTTHCAWNGYLVPHVRWENPTETFQVLPRDGMEFRAIEHCMNTTILTVHTSYKKNPYKAFDVKEIKRYQNGQKLSTCRNRSGAFSAGHMPRYFFHGTSQEIVSKILNEGFRLSSCGDWGQGIYMAENSSTAHLFAKDRSNSDGLCYMLFCLVNLGQIKVYHEDKKNWTSDRFKESNSVCCIHHKYHEFVLYNPERIYPAYVIKYQVIPGMLEDA